MPLETICFFTSVDKDGNEFNISLKASSINAEKANVLLKVNDNTDINSIEIPIEVDITRDQFFLPALTFSLGGFASCMALCCLPSLAQEIAKCVQNCKSNNNNNNNNNAQCLISCLKAKGHKITPSLTKCATSCGMKNVA